MPFLKFSSRHCGNIRKTKDLAERFSESGLSLLNTFCKLPPVGTTLGIHSGAPRQLKTDTDLWFLYHPKPFLPGITLGSPPQRESSSQGSPKEAPGGAGNAAVSSLPRRLITPLFQPSLRWGPGWRSGQQTALTRKLAPLNIPLRRKYNFFCIPDGVSPFACIRYNHIAVMCI